MDWRMQCDKCRREAVLFQEYSGLHLCKQHFEADFERKAKHEIRSHRWLVPGDHIAVALSGDANSSALLCFLKKLTSSRRDIRISAISIDEGITGYRDPGIAKGIAGLSGTECIRVSFPERLGITVDEIAHRKGIALSCTYCRVIRNYLLNRTAIEHGITKLALGDDLDDVTVSVMKNILQGNSEILIHADRTGTGKIPMIRPFITIPRKEVALYATLNAGGYDKSRCPYNNKPFEKNVREMLDEFTTRHPATKYALMNLKKNLTSTCTGADVVHSCQQCGEPSYGICMSCRIIDEVTAHGS
jgi:uncharacterized protein (TIGR00269 family)